MATRSISDEEIALIKAMKSRGMKTKDIQFFFNRPERAVNTGRISNIVRGTYGPSASITAASDAEVGAFIDRSYQPSVVAKAIAAQPMASHTQDPLDPAILSALFEHDGSHWRLKAGESDEHECKLGFGFKHSGKWLRAVAALSNNRGGYVLFGVHDMDKTRADGVDLSHAVIGLTGTEFDDADAVKFTEHLKATFDPTPRFRKAAISIDGKRVGVLYVDAHPSRPVIATRQGEDIKEGDIFYRYAAQSSRIKYSDLRALLDQRDMHARQMMMPMVEKLLTIGPDKALIADLTAGSLGDGRHVIQMDDGLVERLKFIKEGEFDEKEGAPALKLLGAVETVGGSKPATKKGFLSMDDLIEAFLASDPTSEPKECIRAAVEGTQADWLPIHFFAREADLSPEDLVVFIHSTKALESRKSWFSQRAEGSVTAYRKASGAGLVRLEEMQQGEFAPIASVRAASAVAAAVLGMQGGIGMPKKALFGALSECLAIAKDHGAVLSAVRRAICRADELLYAAK